MKTPTRPRLLLADDHRMVAEGLKSLLSPDFELAGVVEDGRALLEKARTLHPDVIVADITMPELNGLTALAALRKENPSVKVVILTMHQDPAYARRALEAGALGYVLKHSAPAELVTAIRAALKGATYMSPAVTGDVIQALRRGDAGAADPGTRLTLRQREILQLLAEGYSAKEIAAKLAISTRTVEFHKYQMMETLGVHTNAELIRLAVRQGLVPN